MTVSSFFSAPRKIFYRFDKSTRHNFPEIHYAILTSANTTFIL